jgi:ABC-type glycerol-3-phosphate transport system substrate-binding protein
VCQALLAVKNQLSQEEKTMNKSRSWIFVSLVLVASLLLTACGGETKVLRVWIQWGDNPQQIQALFDKYTAESGVKVEVTAPLEDDKILPSLTGSTPPDVLVLSGGDLVKSYYKEGLVDELSTVIKDGNIDLNDFFPAPLTPCMPCSGTRICLKLPVLTRNARRKPWKSWSNMLTN